MTTQSPDMVTDLERSLPYVFYTSPEVFQQERENIFYREWFCAGREEEIPQVGDYLVLEVAGESVLVVRRGDGTLNAFYNVCAHRGCELALGAAAKPSAGDAATATGSFKGVIRCMYHSWTYNFDGSLRGAPFLREGDEFAKARFSLKAIALDTWGGFFFLNFDPNAAAEGRSLAAALAGPAEEFKRYPLADLRTARRLVYEVDANWKVVMENYNECYHCGGVHPELCELVPAFRQQGSADLDWPSGIPHREGAVTFTWSGTTSRAPFPGLDEAEQTRHKGAMIYPNLLISFSMDHIAAFTIWPRTPDRSTVICDFLFHPAEMARDGFDPSDAVDFWDMINRQDWTVCAGTQRGMHSRGYTQGWYAPMEDRSLDIRRYIAAHLSTQL